MPVLPRLLLTWACTIGVWGIPPLFADEQPRTAAPSRPNILWISAEDISPHLGCYGDTRAMTPRLDRLAAEGIRYTHAFTTAGVCTPCRSGIITGMYQTTLGTHHMRSHARIPPSVRPFPALLREAGYFCTNNFKEDYQFVTPENTWDNSSPRGHWRLRPRDDQPFFSVFNFTGCHESGIANTEKYQAVTRLLSAAQRQDPARLLLPPYYPDVPAVREDWKRNYELITAMDAWASELLDQLREDGLDDSTIVMFWSDHGVGLPRAKRWLYDSGTHIPLIVRVPPKFSAVTQSPNGSVCNELVSSIDLGATVLQLAGIARPQLMQGQAFLGANRSPPRKYVFGARDRMDERYDIIRMVRDERFKYLRNYEPLKTYYQYMNTPEKGASMRAIREGHQSGTLPAAADDYFAPRKPVEELYDTQSDPHELENLASDTRYEAELKRLRDVHLQWVTDTKDLGLIAEPILAAHEQQGGHRFELLRGPGGDALAARVAEAAAHASLGPASLPNLAVAMQDESSAVRYWGATGCGNLGTAAAAHRDAVLELLDDPSSAVRVAAARAACRLGSLSRGLKALARELENGPQWTRLQAAIVLDELDEQALPVIETMRRALHPRSEFYAGGKYVVRVINRALNELEGTAREVK